MDRGRQEDCVKRRVINDNKENVKWHSIVTIALARNTADSVFGKCFALGTRVLSVSQTTPV